MKKKKETMITLMRKKRTAGLMVLCSILLLLLAGCGKHEKEPVTSLKRLGQAGIKIAVALDSPQEISLLHSVSQDGALSGDAQGYG